MKLSCKHTDGVETPSVQVVSSQGDGVLPETSVTLASVESEVD